MICLVIVALFSLFGNSSQQDDSRKASPPKSHHRESSDVVIVGAGISGLSAALELGRAGVDVTVVDMASVFGGHAVMSQGGLCIVGSPEQQASGIDDSAELAYQDFITWGEDPDTGWVRYYVDHSRTDIYDWVHELGVRFEPQVGVAPGNSVNRMIQPTGRGVGLVTPIFRQCQEHSNIHFVWNQQAEQLVIENNQVKGVVCRDTRKQTQTTFKADFVILATGGFQSNLSMVREFWPAEFKFPKRILVGSGLNSVGHGHRMAQAVGAKLVKMDHQWNYFTGIPDPRYPDSDRGLSAANMYGIIVNSKGKRVGNLHNWAKEVTPAMLRQDDATLWFIFDEATKPRFVVSGSDWADFNIVDRVILQNETLVQSADSLDGLAEKTGLPAENLKATLQRWNQLVTDGKDLDFDRFGPMKTKYNNEASPKLETPPFYAMQTYPLTRKSMGGVAINLKCEVLDKTKSPIRSLYAVGELTGLAGINGKASLEGTFLGPCILTGRVAARSILKEPALNSANIKAREQSCISCHKIEQLIKQNRPGYWHFDAVHKRVLSRGSDCRSCHAELVPYRKDAHQISQQALATSCVQCHVAREVR